MAFTIAVKGETIGAVEINDNFYHIADGNRNPMGGISLETTDGAYDLGTDTERWDKIHIDNIDIASGAEIEKTWTLIAEETLTNTATSIEFTGLNGDTDEIYNIVAKFVLTTNSNSEIRMVYNNDSSASYGVQFLYAAAGAVAANRASSQNYIRIAEVDSSSITTHKSFSELLIYAKSGHERMSHTMNLRTGGNSYVGFLFNWGGIWNNTAGTITSIKIYPSSNYFITNTTIQIWSKR